MTDLCVANRTWKPAEEGHIPQTLISNVHFQLLYSLLQHQMTCQQYTSTCGDAVTVS